MGLSGYVVLPIWLITYGLGYAFRNSGGVGIPGVENVKVDILRILIKNEPQSASSLAFEHYVIWILFYGLAHFVMYVEPQRSLFRPFKLNPNYPPVSLVLKEIFRSVRGVAICTLYAVLVNNLHDSGDLPSNLVPDIFDNDGHHGNVTYVNHMLGALMIYLWGDFHFYWTHRLLHTPWFYKSVHKTHHESYNPDPFSGLSMHWFESAVYFSAAPLLALGKIISLVSKKVSS